MNDDKQVLPNRLAVYWQAQDIATLVPLLGLRRGQGQQALVRQVQDYLEHLKTQGLSPAAPGAAAVAAYFGALATRRKRKGVIDALSRLRVFFRALRDAGVLPAGQDPLYDYRLTTDASLPTAPYPPDQLALLRQTLDSPPLRLAVLLALSGLQIHEITSVTAADVSLASGEILTPRGVSRAEPELLTLLQDWTADGPLIAPVRDEGGPGQWLRRQLKTHCDRHGLRYRGFQAFVTSYALRVMQETPDEDERLRLLRLRTRWALKNYTALAAEVAAQTTAGQTMAGQGGRLPGPHSAGDHGG